MDIIFNQNEHTTGSLKTQKPSGVKTINFNPFHPEFYQNPYPMYHRLRSEEPIHKSVMGMWVLTRYIDVKAVLWDPRFRTDQLPKRLAEKGQRIEQLEFDSLTIAISKWLLFLDPPDHTRLRRIASKALLHWTGERIRPLICTTVEELLSKVRYTGFMDIIADFASPLPTIVIAKMLGVPEADHNQLHRWSDELFHHIFEPLISLEGYEYLNQISQKFIEYFQGLIAEREKNPQDDLLSFLIAGRDQGEHLSEDELLSICIVLFSAGEQTTSNLIGNGMLALLRHPEQMEKLKQEPNIIQSAVEELLRYDSSTQIVAREAIEDVVIGDQTIRSGEQVFLCLGAANRDPAQFPNPDCLDFTRSENCHLAFGSGIHYCVAAAQARSQGQIAINALVQQLPNLRFQTETLEWRKHMILRSLKALPVTFVP
jgi:pimeloyl-[acyl-carrier protein] synthase